MTEQAAPTVKVWDPAVRLFHWTLVAAFTIAWLTGDDWDRVHETAGYVILALIAFRLAWGLIGPRHARFRQFVRRPSAVTGYLRATVTGREPRYLGHNPAGGAMIVALLAGLVVTAGSGWMMTLDRFWGVEWVEEVHETAANLMLVLIGLHLAGVALASLRHGENLVRAMVNGRKRRPAAGDVT